MVSSENEENGYDMERETQLRESTCMLSPRLLVQLVWNWQTWHARAVWICDRFVLVRNAPRIYHLIAGGSLTVTHYYSTYICRYKYLSRGHVLEKGKLFTGNDPSGPRSGMF